MDFYSLKLFLHLCDTLHFGKTSAACFLSPSALSRQIKRMEDELGHQLFERDKRSVQLTHAGELFRDYSKDVIQKFREVNLQLDQQSGDVTGDISLYCSVTASYTLLPEILGKFRNKYPQVHVVLQTGDAASAVQRLVEDEADLTIAALPDKLPDGVLFERLTETKLILIAPKIEASFMKLLQLDPIPWDKIPMVLAEKGLGRKRFDSWFRSMNIQPKIYADVSGNEAILSMVSLGCGIGVVPELVVQKSPLADSLQVLDVKHPLKPYTVGVCVKQRKLMYRQVKTFWDLVRDIEN
jgi:LysR family positive regulator for ilvC